jgi:signal peptidase I
MSDQAPIRPNKTLRDIISIVGFVAAIWLGAVLLNTFVFQTYTVNGESMEDTLHTGDHLFVNKLPVTSAHLTSKQFIPERGKVIVFENPLPDLRKDEAFIVKRVVGLPGEQVVVKEGKVTVFNKDHPKGFSPDTTYQGPKSPTEGEVDITVPENELFVIGDNRIGQHSFDSRNGLSTIPLTLVQGEATARIYPFNQWRGF